MTKKLKLNENPKLSPGLYWEWRCTMEELKFAKLNEKKVHLDRELMNKELENRKLKLALYKDIVKSARGSVENAELEYGNIKKRMEEEIGMSFENCVIDEYTYEVKKLDTDESKS